MHKIVCRLGLRPRPRWGSLQRSPRPPSWIQGVLLLREGRGGRTGGRARERQGREGEGMRGKGKRTSKRSHSSKFTTTSLVKNHLHKFQRLRNPTKPRVILENQASKTETKCKRSCYFKQHIKHLSAITKL